MALSSPGVGSGLDVNSLVTQLMAVERAPIAALDKKEISYQAKLSSYGTLKSSLAALQTAARAIATPDKLTPVKASVGDATLFGATVGANAAAGTFDVEVKSLAQSQKLKTAGSYANLTDVVGTGTITFDFGTYSGAAPPTFAANAAKPGKSIVLTSENNTLAGMRDAINAADLGVSASIINDGTANYLTFTSKDTGARNALKVTVSDPASLGALAYDPTAGGVSSMGQIVPAKDALIVVDTVSVYKPSNTITDAIQGVTLSLSKESPGTSTKVTLTRDTSGVQAAVQAFVKAYNDTSKAMADATSYDIATGKGATLNGDSTVRGFQSQLRGLFKVPVAGAPSGLSVMSDVGITFQRDGSLAIDAAKFAAANADPTKDLSKLFATSASTKGYGYQMDVLIGKMLSPVGTMVQKTNSVSKSIKELGTQRDDVNARLVSVEKRYRAQFSALDTLVSKMTTTSSYLTQQLASIAKNG